MHLYIRSSIHLPFIFVFLLLGSRRLCRVLLGLKIGLGLEKCTDARVDSALLLSTPRIINRLAPALFFSRLVVLILERSRRRCFTILAGEKVTGRT